MEYAHSERDLGVYINRFYYFEENLKIFDPIPKTKDYFW